MRTQNSIKNAITAVIMQISVILFGFIIQKVLLNYLGLEYTGLNSLFSNIISMLAIVELGIGSAITFHLYKPIAENDRQQIKILMKFYKICYRVIAIIVFIIGIIIIPFLPKIVGEVNVNESIVIIYLLFLLDTILSYLFTYKRTIIIANQRNYYINIIHTVTYTFFTIIQIVITIYLKNFYAYLIVKVISRFIENIIISHFANKLYPFIKEKEDKKMPKEVLDDIIKKVKALFVHKISSFLVSGTDNIIISTFLGVTTVGYYSNYSMVINALTILISQIFAGLTASIGNLLVKENNNKIYEVFKKIYFINFVVGVIGTAGIVLVINNIIAICFGKQYILSMFIVFTLAFTFYFNITRQCMGQFKEAAGIFYEDRFIPLIESLVNLVFSIIFLKFFGLAGVFMGTIMSSMVLHLYSYPKFVYKGVLKRRYKEYFKMFFGYTCLAIIIILASYFIKEIISTNNVVISTIISVIIAIMIPTCIIIILFRKKDEYKFFKEMIMDKILRREENL